MLGIRRFQSTALDLWVGPKRLFHADLKISDSQAQEVAAVEGAHWAIHVEAEETHALFELIKTKIQQHSPRRCTFMLEDVAGYDSLEQSFFSAFPE